MMKTAAAAARAIQAANLRLTTVHHP